MAYQVNSMLITSFHAPLIQVPVNCRAVDAVNSELVGESAAVTTSLLWTMSSIYFTSASKRIGWLGVNAYRILVAICFLAVTHIVFLGTLVPLANGSQWFWMGLSGIVGLGI